MMTTAVAAPTEPPYEDMLTFIDSLTMPQLRILSQHLLERQDALMYEPTPDQLSQDLGDLLARLTDSIVSAVGKTSDNPGWAEFLSRLNADEKAVVRALLERKWKPQGATE